MTYIEQKALALVNEVLAEWGVMKNAVEIPKNIDAFACALIRAIEQHEAFRQKVSDAVEDAKYMVETHCDTEALALVSNRLNRFIIPAPKPDSLSEVWRELFANEYNLYEFVAALEARGLEIREKNND